MIKFLLESRHASDSNHHCLSLENMTSKQRLLIKSSIVNANNCLNSIFPSFNFLNSKLQGLDQLIYFLVDFHFTKHIIKIKDLKLLIFANLTISFLIHHLVSRQSLLFQIQVLETMLPLPSHIPTHIPTLSRKLFIMLCQVWFILEGESSWSWFGNAQSIETLHNELSNVNLLESGLSGGLSAQLVGYQFVLVFSFLFLFPFSYCFGLM